MNTRSSGMVGPCALAQGQDPRLASCDGRYGSCCADNKSGGGFGTSEELLQERMVRPRSAEQKIVSMIFPSSDPVSCRWYWGKFCEKVLRHENKW